MTHNYGEAARSTGKGSTISNLGLYVTNNGTFRNSRERKDVSTG